MRIRLNGLEHKVDANTQVLLKDVVRKERILVEKYILSKKSKMENWNLPMEKQQQQKKDEAKYQQS